jgi:hypothetical protein
VISAADGQALQTAQQISDSVRTAYQQQPDAMLIADGTLNPLELVVVDGQSGRYYRIPVTSNGDGSFSFGAPIPVTGPAAPNVYPQPPGSSAPTASRGVPARDRQRIQAAIARGAIPSWRAAFWEQKAAAGEDISVVDQAVGGLLPATGTVAAAVSRGGAQSEPEEDLDEYHALYGSRQDGERAADAREVAARTAVAALTDDQVYESMFGKASAAAAPVAASASGPAGQRGRGEARTRRYRVHAPSVSLRVPQHPDGPAASAESATSWRVIYLHGGDLVPVDAHPDDIARLLHQRNRLGPLIKRW